MYKKSGFAGYKNIQEFVTVSLSDKVHIVCKEKFLKISVYIEVRAHALKI